MIVHYINVHLLLLLLLSHLLEWKKNVLNELKHFRRA